MEKLPTPQKVDNEVKYFFEVAPSKIIRSGSDSFTYSSSLELPIGAVVKIPVGKKEFIARAYPETIKDISFGKKLFFDFDMSNIHFFNYETKKNILV